METNKDSKLCGNCKFWKTNDFSLKGFGECMKIPCKGEHGIEEASKLKELKAFTSDSSCWFSKLNTREDFGCNLFDIRVEGEQLPENPKKKIFDVWCEGFSATGQSEQARLLGSEEAYTFQEACEMLSKKVCVGFWSKDCTTMYGCRLFDNEADARRSFG